MSKPANSIHINGRRYDAHTGHPLDGGPAIPARRSVDGVVSHKKSAVKLAEPRIKPVAVPQPLSKTKLMDMKAPKSRTPRAAAKAAPAHAPQTAHTLMRHVVKKPAPSLKRSIVAHSSTDHALVMPSITVTPKHSITKVPAVRLQRAKQVTKSAQIRKFPAATPAVRVVSTPVVEPIAPLPIATERPLDIFEQALHHANTHLQPPVAHHKHPKRRARLAQRRTSVAATALAILLLVGFMGFENRTNLSLKLAASKAGFNANLPGYRPSGFSVGALNYSPGNVAIHYHSNSDDRSFAVLEQPSAWNSSTLRDSLVANADSQYQTVAVSGRTVYLYGDNNAAWVNGGVLYQVKTDGALSSNQVTELAKSL